MILSIIKKVGGAVVLITLIFTDPAWSVGDDFVIGAPPCNEGEPEKFAGFPVEVFPDMDFLKEYLESLLAVRSSPAADGTKRRPPLY